jgi:hypothetical protein
MNRLLASVVALSLLCGAVALPRIAPAQSYPVPNPYPIAWELDFRHATPKRIVVEIPGESVPRAFWYMTYTVVNRTDREQMFLPVFEMVTQDGQIIRSDRSIPARVFEVIKQREGNRFLEPVNQVAGMLRVGEDEARDSVAIWPEPTRRMGSFTLFVAGLSGESVALTDAQGNMIRDEQGMPQFLRKTLQLDYQVRGDENFPDRHPVVDRGRRWVMR